MLDLYLLPGGGLTLGNARTQGQQRITGDTLPEEARSGMVQIVEAPSPAAARFAARLLRFREGSDDNLSVIWRTNTIALCYSEGDGSIERYDSLAAL